MVFIALVCPTMVTRWVLWTTLELQSHPAPSSTVSGGMPHEWCVRRSSRTQQLPQKVRFNSANGAHFVISWLKSCRLALMLTQIEINKANPACPSRNQFLLLAFHHISYGCDTDANCVCLLCLLAWQTVERHFWQLTVHSVIVCVCVGEGGGSMWKITKIRLT